MKTAQEWMEQLNCFDKEEPVEPMLKEIEKIQLDAYKQAVHNCIEISRNIGKRFNTPIIVMEITTQLCKLLNKQPTI